jgi:hypothetical protein
LFLLAWLVCAGVVCWAQAPAASGQAQAGDALQWRSGLSEISENWLEHEGDNLAWARPGFDDSGWTKVDDLKDMGPAKAGWRWFRKRVALEPNHRHVHLLIQGGDGTYELYVNGVRAEGAKLKSDFDVKRPTEQVFPLADGAGSYVFALRTHAPANYAAFQLPLFLSVTLGNPTAIDYERQALESQRLYSVLASVGINLVLCLAAFAAFALFAYQQTHREYLYLGLYLLLSGLSDGQVACGQAGVLPTSADFLYGDPLTFLFSIAQIEFTFAFAGRRVGRGWRTYEFLLLCPLILVALAWGGHFPYAAYEIVEACITLPVALMLPLLLFVWWRRGNREAALLILPSMLPAGTGILSTLGSVSIYSGWGRFDFLANQISVGSISIHSMDLGTLLFLLAIGVVMFFRFTRVSREQARAAAELEAAREIQQRLVPASLPPVPGWRLEAAYVPAQEVGGDFYQVLEQPDGSTLIVVGDVSGKGLKAAMTGTLAIGALRTLSSENLRPGELLERLNREMVRGQDGGFVTCLCARITAEDRMTVANAGHIPPYRNGEELSVPAGLPLGLDPDAEYGEAGFAVEAGETITLLSDGVVEARNAAGELFGFERTQTISRNSAQAIADAARRFGQEDDITVLTLQAVAGGRGAGRVSSVSVGHPA